VCAIRAAQLGLKAAVIDKQWLGGVCLNVGCIPSKALLRSAEIAHLLREGGKEFGFSFENLQLDYSAAVKRSRQVSARLTKGVGFLMKKNNIEVIMGNARLTGRNSVNVIDESGATKTIMAANIVIATGANVAIPPGWRVDGEVVVTYHEAILQEKLPQSAVIIGAGAIGVEFATIWSSYGSEVTIVEMLPRILPLEDEEISAELTKALNKRKIKRCQATASKASRSRMARRWYASPARKARKPWKRSKPWWRLALNPTLTIWGWRSWA
jgi:dihydrolipoamide dehydrogenase